MKTAAFHTLGCRVNAYETEAMQEQLKRDGYVIVPFSEKADVYIINTCTVTHIADRKSRQMLHRARRMNPDALIIAAGCYVEDAGEELLSSGDADLLIGNADKASLAGIIRAHREGRPEETRFLKHCARPDYGPLFITETEGRTRAFLKIEDGCNQFCSYCVIPYVRGRVRSRRAEDVLAEAERLLAGGFQELVLTGIHVSSYGLDLREPGRNLRTPEAREAETNRELLSLVRSVASLPGIRRLRFGSLEPGIMTEEFVRALSEIPVICPQFHLSLQSGCDATLQRMRRRYDTAAYEEIVGRLRAAYSNPAIATDIIAGFPGETEEEFAETVAFVKRIGFEKTHIFPYSERKGTKAADMPGRVAAEVRRQRSEVLIDLDIRNHRRYAEGFLGREVEVLFEERKRVDGIIKNAGHTREMLLACAASAQDLTGQLIKCRVTSVTEAGGLLVTPSADT